MVREYTFITLKGNAYVMKNDRRDFLKLSAVFGAASLLPFRSAGAQAAGPATSPGCALIPNETLGPFPLDLSTNTFYFRKDIRETRTGTPLNMKMRILGTNNCAPMPNVRVNIWHCDKDGQYSGYDNNANPGQAGLTYLRGYQVTDANGEVNFVTVFPGWYGGRVCHIHFQVYVSSSYAAVSQLAWPPETVDAVYAANPSQYTKGPDPLTPATDGVFRNGNYQLQMATLAANAGGGYDSFIELSVNGTGTVGLGREEIENARHFELGQSFPNPHSGEATIPFVLRQPADVVVDLWDLSGKKVASLPARGLGIGNHRMDVRLASLGLAPSDYLYQVEVKNASGTFKQFKMMTARR